MRSIRKIAILLMISFAVLLNNGSKAYSAIDTTTYITDESEIYELIREAMVERESALTINYAKQGELKEGYYERWMEAALMETGESDAGDYLRWHLGESGISGGAYVYPGEMYYYTLELNLTYYTTEEQEKTVEDEIKRVFEELSIDDLKTDYEKVKVIYDYVCQNISYDYNNLYDKEYTLKYSAYAALINETAVCQGYANLMYRMLHEAGIDSRIISGTGNGEAHAWNIVELDEQYYYLDATWDAIRGGYEYFLKGSETFTEHECDAKYISEKFVEEYPIAKSDYMYVEPTIVAGDANDDDVVNAFDVIMLKRYLAGWDVEIELEAGDVNDDGFVNAFDVIILRRYLAGWDVDLI